MHLLLTGATGLVGSAVLQTMLSTPSVSKITILSRRPVAQADTEGKGKVVTIIQKDFATYDESTLEGLKDVKGVVWALGISSTQVSKPEYEAITNTYALAFAKAIAKTTNPNPVNFIYVSGEGATTTPGVMTQHWARIKGETEASLLALSKEKEYGNLRVLSCRPGGVDPSHHQEIHSYVPARTGVAGLAEKLLVPPLRALMPKMISPTRELGLALTQLAMGEGGVQDGEGVSGEGRTLNNAALRRLAGL